MLHCTPHPGLGAVVVRRSRIDLAACLTSKAPPVAASVATVRVTKDSQSIVFKGKVVLTVHENHTAFPAGSPGPIELEGVSPDEKWILYAIDPMGSASLAADGLRVMAVPATGGRTYTVAFALSYDSYRAWCGDRLVMTVGGDRIANHDKRLIVTGPPSWRARFLVREPKRAFGSVACAPDGRAVVVQEEPAGGTNESSATSHWQLWRLTLDGRTSTRLTDPAPGWSDDSPQFSADGKTLYFVRSKSDRGRLYALRGGELVGPLLDLGLDRNEYYGHRDWPYRVVP